MTARRLLPLLATAVLFAAGCDDDDAVDTTPPPTATTTQPEPEPPSAETKGVVLSLDRTTPHAGETLRLTVENRTRTRLEYGLAYRLEQRTGDRWKWINKDAAVALILKIVEPGKRESENIQLPNDLQPGRYRIVKSFTAPETGRVLDASVEFTVANR